MAAEPRARQLLDELRALSAALQSLPQQKLGEDLSRQVLRVAERRMLTEGEPDDAAPSPAAPMPLVRSLSKRFLSRRTLLWTGLAVAIAVMISIDEHNKKAPLANKEVAIARVDHAKAAKTEKLADSKESALSKKLAEAAGPPPSIQARDYTDKRVAEPAAKLPEERLKEKPAAPTEKSAYGNIAKTAAKPAAKPADRENLFAAAAPPAPAPSAPVASAAKSYRVTSPAVIPPAHEMAKGGRALGRGQSYGDESKAGDGPVQLQIEQAAPLGQGVLVVYCDLTRTAVEKKAFDKLLDANGITWRRQQMQRSKKPTNGYVAGGLVVGQDETAFKNAAKQQFVTDKSLRRLYEAGDAELVYAEATPAQVAAAMAGLTAQPNVSRVSVEPSQAELAQQMVPRFALQRRAAGFKAAGGMAGADEKDFGGSAGRYSSMEGLNRQAPEHSQIAKAPAKQDKAAAPNLANNAAPNYTANAGPSPRLPTQRETRRKLKCQARSSPHRRKPGGNSTPRAPPPQHNNPRKPNQRANSGQRTKISGKPAENQHSRSRRRSRCCGSKCCSCCGSATKVPPPRPPFAAAPMSKRANPLRHHPPNRFPPSDRVATFRAIRQNPRSLSHA